VRAYIDTGETTLTR